MRASSVPSPTGAWLERGARLLAALALAFILAKTLAFHRQLLGFPYPLDSHEPAEGLLAQGVAAGLSTGDLQNLPLYSDHYGPLYSLLCGKLCGLGFACDVPSQRLLASLCLAAVLGLLAAACRKAGAGRLATAAILVWAYGLLLINVTPTARPDAFGTLLWFAGLALPFLLDYGVAALAAASVLFGLAAATKLYFLVGPLYLAAGLWAGGRKPAFWRFLALQAAVLGIVGAWMEWRYPYDFYASAMNQTNNLNFAWGYMLFQLWQLLVIVAPCTLPLAFAAAAGLWMEGGGLRATGAEWGVYAGLGLALFVLFLGGALGARYTYLVQLALLPSAPWLATAFRSLRKFSGLLLALAAANAVSTGLIACHDGFDPRGEIRRHWDAAQQRVALSASPVSVSAMDLGLFARGLPVYDSGLNHFGFVDQSYASWWRDRLFPRCDLLAARDAAWRERVRGAMLDPRTDLLVLTAESPLYFRDIVDAKYALEGRIVVLYPQTGGGDELLFFARKAGHGR